MKSIIFIYYLSVMLIIPLNWVIGDDQQSVSSDSLKLLFLGNSLTGYKIPEDVFGLANNSNKSIYIDKLILGGTSLYEISQLENLHTKITEEDWDYIIMQDSPYRVAYPHDFPAYPTRQAIESIIDIIGDKNQFIKLMFFMPYAYKDGMAWYQNYTDDFFLMQEKIYDYSKRLANDYNLIITPVGWAWYDVMASGNNNELYLADLAHPSYEGSYLSACVIYSSIFDESLNNNDYLSSLTPNAAYYLQNVATSTVMNELEQWNYLSTKMDNNFINDNFILHQNYPNPFNPETTISFELSEDTYINVSVYDLLGNVVKELIDKSVINGNHKIKWSGIDNFGKHVSAGVYLYTIQTDEMTIAKKMLLLR